MTDIKKALILTKDKWLYLKDGEDLEGWDRFGEIEYHLNHCPLCEYSEIKSPDDICSACPIDKYSWCSDEFRGDDDDTLSESIDMLIGHIDYELSLLGEGEE